MKKKFMLISIILALASNTAYAGIFDFLSQKEDVTYHSGVAEKVNNNFNKVETELNKKADAANVYSKNDVDNLVNTKADAANVYSKSDVDSLVNTKADTSYVDTAVKGAEENANKYTDSKIEGVKQYTDDKFVDKTTQTGIDATQNKNIDNINKVNDEQNKNIDDINKVNDEQNKNIETNKQNIAKETEDRVAEDARIEREYRAADAAINNRIDNVEKRIDNLDDKLSKGLSLMAAMSAVDFQEVREGEMAIGAGFGHYGNAQSVAVGVAYSPVENLHVNAKYSVTAGDIDSFAIGVGASYKFRVK